MTLCIHRNDGSQLFTTEYDTIEQLKAAIDQNTPIRCWFYMTHGQRITETYLFTPDCIMLLRTESDD